MNKVLSVLTITAILLSFGACKKKEEQPVPNVPVSKGPIIESPVSSPHSTGQKLQFNTVIPPGVKDKWSAVTLLVKDKKANTTEEVTVPLGDELTIPDSKLTIKIGVFLPDFKMSGQIITSASNAPNNPTVGVKIYEDGKQIFPEEGDWGWLYANFPTIHPFQHEQYELALKEGVKK